ncbi:hypothetical protein [Methylocystis echinoides]|uniref:hypothetical protein n=1 Tax=Methylocystis echinoides TaxID=29468 RepID=UPI00341E1597
MRPRIGSRALLMETDGRTAWARRYKDLVALLIDDLGGMAGLTELKLGLIRRAATLMLSCERLETDIAEGREVDLDLLGRLIGHVRRVAETLGLDRAVKDVTPSLADIVANSANPHHNAARKAACAPRQPATVIEAEPAQALHGAPEPIAEAGK